MSPIHPPKKMISAVGLGLTSLGNTSEFLGNDVIITTKQWEEIEKHWTQGDTVIAQEGYKWITSWELNKPYLLTKILDAQNNLVGIYCDICSPVQREGISFICYDWYLDVWKTATKPSELLDEDELASALEQNYLTPKEAQIAKATALFLMEALGHQTIT
jgi:predicted RNA-binding protein associated with RNAse of E/G family